jgi:hypothetical protein
MNIIAIATIIIPSGLVVSSESFGDDSGSRHTV